MCGRFALVVNSDKIKAQFSLETLPELHSRYNVTPGQEVLFLTHNNNETHAELFRWGIIPFFSKDKKTSFSMINARAETVFEKPAFRQSIQSKRGLMVMSGYFEWHEEEGRKQPYYFKHSQGNYLAMAAFWDIWQSPEEVIRSCCLLTTKANELGASIHPRMPVILTPKEQSLWMNNDVFNKEQLIEVMQPYKLTDITRYPVSSLMNNSRFEDKRAILPLRN